MNASHSGWFLKKAKTDKAWGKSHHSHRYFVSRGAALSYHEGNPEGRSGAHVRGVIDLRQVKRVRPSVDTTAPEFAIDLVYASRTYVLVPQPATPAERAAWVITWMRQMHGDIIAPELRAEATSQLAGDASSSSAGSAAEPAGGTGSDGAPAASSPSAWPTPRVLMQGFLHKQPVKHSGQRSMSAKDLFADLSGWKRRYFLLRPGTLQWFRDDPGANGEFLGVLRLTPEARVELETGQQRLRVHAGGETLVLKEDGNGRTLLAWERALLQHVASLSTAGAPGTDAGDGGAGMMVDHDLEEDAIPVE